MGLFTGLAVLLGWKKPIAAAEVKPIPKRRWDDHKSPLEKMRDRAGPNGILAHNPNNFEVNIRYNKDGPLKQHHFVEAKGRMRVVLKDWPLVAIMNQNTSTVYLAVEFPPGECYRLHFGKEVYWLDTEDGRQPDLSNHAGDTIVFRFWSWGDSVVYAVVEQ